MLVIEINIYFRNVNGANQQKFEFTCLLAEYAIGIILLSDKYNFYILAFIFSPSNHPMTLYTAVLGYF